MIQLEFRRHRRGAGADAGPHRGRLLPARGAERAAWDDEKLELVGRHAPGRLPRGRLARELLRLGAVHRTLGEGKASAATTRAARTTTCAPSSRRSPATRPTRAAYPWIAFQGRWGELQPAFFNGPDRAEHEGAVDRADHLVGGLATHSRRPGRRPARAPARPTSSAARSRAARRCSRLRPTARLVDPERCSPGWPRCSPGSPRGRPGDPGQPLRLGTAAFLGVRTITTRRGWMYLFEATAVHRDRALLTIPISDPHHSCCSAAIFSASAGCSASATTAPAGRGQSCLCSRSAFGTLLTLFGSSLGAGGDRAGDGRARRTPVARAYARLPPRLGERATAAVDARGRGTDRDTALAVGLPHPDRSRARRKVGAVRALRRARDPDGCRPCTAAACSFADACESAVPRRRLALLVLLSGPVVGGLLLVATGASFGLINGVAGVIYALTMPLAGITTIYVYYDALTGEHLAQLEPDSERAPGRDRRGLSHLRPSSELDVP